MSNTLPRLPEPLIITGKHLGTPFPLPDREAASQLARGRAVQVHCGLVAAVVDVSFHVPRQGRGFTGWGKPTGIRMLNSSSH